MFYKPNFSNAIKDNIKNLNITSPKLKELLDNIKRLDENDLKTKGKLFKHFIFTDVKNIYGLRMIISAMKVSGEYDIVMEPVVKRVGKKSQRRIEVSEQMIQNNKKNKKTSVAFLSSVKINNYNYSTSIIKKQLLSPDGVFNNRKSNVNGENIRIIVLDSGFKEGIDLFDIKYCHIFDTFNTESDKKQAIGRALRYCGQSGLSFDNGWKLSVFMYKTLYKDLDLGEVYWDKKVNNRSEILEQEEKIDGLFRKCSLNSAL